MSDWPESTQLAELGLLHCFPAVLKRFRGRKAPRTGKQTAGTPGLEARGWSGHRYEEDASSCPYPARTPALSHPPPPMLLRREHRARGGEVTRQPQAWPPELDRGVLLVSELWQAGRQTRNGDGVGETGAAGLLSMLPHGNRAPNARSGCPGSR